MNGHLFVIIGNPEEHAPLVFEKPIEDSWLQPERLKHAGRRFNFFRCLDLDTDIISFSAVINPPQGFILAIGKITKIPVVDDGDLIVVGHRMSITMSCDHRVIDGALGAEYLKELRHLLENPALLLV